MTADPFTTRLAVAEEAEILGGMRWAWSHEDDPVHVGRSGERSEYVAAFADWARAHAATHLAWLAFADDQPVGMAWLALVPRPPAVGAMHRVVGDIQSVYVAPQWRSKGIGAQLMAAIIAEARARGLTNLSVRADIRARPFYRMIGFIPDGGLLDMNLRSTDFIARGAKPSG